MTSEAFLRLFGDLPRQGPGSDVYTLEVLHRLPALPAKPSVYDLGCGTGRATLVLARALKVPIIAVDLEQRFLDRLQQSALKEKLADLVKPRLTDLREPGAQPGTIDLIWAEGSIFSVGFGKGLELWRPLLRGQGLVVVSEASWLVDKPAAEVQAFWDKVYPAITSIDDNKAIAVKAGYEVLEHLVLPRHTWFQEYYDPLTRRIEELRPAARADAELARVIQDAEREIDICQRFGASYGYVFYLLRRA